MASEFWGVEVKNGVSLKVDPGGDKILRISQAALGESKHKGNEPVYLYLTVKSQKLIIGTLNQEKFPHLSFEILVEKGFELSHSWKHGSVYFTGYKLDAGDTDTDDYSDDKLPISVDNGKLTPNANQAKPDTKKADAPKSGSKQVNFNLPNEEAKAEQDDEDSDKDSEDDSLLSEDSGDDKGKKVNVGGDDKVDSDDDDDDDDDDDEDDDDSSEEETPKKPEPNKKRPAEPATPKVQGSEKKAKFATPQKTEANKSSVVHVATPHPAKQMGKKAGSSGGSKQQTPKSGGSYQCKACNRSFTTEVGLESHRKAKHA